MNNRYVLKVCHNNLQVIDTTLFTAEWRDGVCVLFVGCGNNRAKLESNLKQIVAEYDIAPQNIKYANKYL